DIGDQQSLEDDLSTYSSRLRNARIFLEKADDKTLVLIDEFGSGTDPKIGGAIAEAILHNLNKRKVHGIITTHYSNLKIFAFKSKGIVNGSMRFDRKSLNPTYEFNVGRPGSSYAFEIAEKSGLQGHVLQYAQKRTGENQKAVDQLLMELQRERQELEEKMKQMLEKERKLERLVKTYDQMHLELDVRRKKMKLENKENALQQVAKDNKELEKLIREIREEQNLEKAKELAAAAKEQRKTLVENVQELREEVYYQPKKTIIEERPIVEGDYVKLKSGGATGVVESIDRKRAIVLMGEMRMTIKLRDLQLAKAPLDIRSKRSVTADTLGVQADFKTRIDIRGMRYDEAMLLVEEFVDQALIKNATNLRIVHGKGTGVLRKAVKRKLREYNVGMKVRHPHAEDGGDGVTIVEL
ncbi:MAG: Smr/MutS family protein, partial [Bacteroidota bacterium]